MSYFIRADQFARHQRSIVSMTVSRRRFKAFGEDMSRSNIFEKVYRLDTL
jgi:hypothetical protein